MLQATRSVPIVFVVVPDPVGSGFVESLAQPGGNATGFVQFEYSLSAKWLELLKEIAPSVTRAAVLRDPAISTGIGQFAVIQYVAPSVGVDVRVINLRDAAEIERSVAAFARTPNGGLILTAGALSAVHRDLIISLAARFKLPATYQERAYVAAGGLVSYGPILSTSTVVQRAMSTASSRARNRPTCRCRRRPNMSLRSILRLPRHSVSPFRRRCSPALTR